MERASAQRLQAGDHLLFEGGAIFAGTLRLDPEDSGSSEEPVVADSCGTGDAILSAGDAQAVAVDQSQHLKIRNLKLVGSGRKSGNIESGLYISGAEDIEVDSVEISGFQHSGLYFSGVERGRFTRIHAWENGFSGILSRGEWSRHIYVGHCLTENNPGDPTILDNHCGNGIVLEKIRNGCPPEKCRPLCSAATYTILE